MITVVSATLPARLLTSLAIASSVAALSLTGPGVHADPAPPLFGAPTQYPVGSSPEFLATGDFDGDGHPDLVTANFYGTTSVLLGNGDGTYQSARSMSVGDRATSVGVGDFDGDGNADLVVAARQLLVLLGNGDGSFQAPVSYSPGPGSAGRVVVADLNADGRPDLAVVNASQPRVGVLLSNGDGTFGAATTYSTGIRAASLAVGDLDGDGNLDVVTANSEDIGNAIKVLLGTGDGTFTGQRLDPVTDDARYLTSVAIGDLDADGKPDLAITTPEWGSLLVLPGNGDGSFQAAVEHPNDEGVQVAISDLNRDGNLDLVTAGNGNSGSIQLSLGTGQGAFAAPVSFDGGQSADSMVIRDLSGDGIPDLAVTNPGGSTVSVVLGAKPAATPDPTPEPAPTSPAPSTPTPAAPAASSCPPGSSAGVHCTVVNGVTYFYGTDGPDVIVGTDGPDRIFGHRGDDTIVPGGGRDHARGGRGDDAIDTKDGFRDVVRGGRGDDDLRTDQKDVRR